MSSDKILGEEQFAVLKEVQKIFSKDAIIAGGAVRDMIMGKPFRDVDIWIPNKTKNLTRNMEYDLPRALGLEGGQGEYITLAAGTQKPKSVSAPLLRWTEPRAEEVDEDLYATKSPISSVFNMGFKESFYQLILVKESPLKMVENFFDVGFCQAWHDGKRVGTLPAFDKDKEQKTFTLDKSRMEPGAFDTIIRKRIPSLQKKYPDFKLVEIGEFPKKKEPIPYIFNVENERSFMTLEPAVLGMTAEEAHAAGAEWNFWHPDDRPHGMTREEVIWGSSIGDGFRRTIARWDAFSLEWTIVTQG